jgi:membrane protein DedA with SNARE-associated domain
MEAVFEWVSTYGYGAIFLLLALGIVGLPIPDETLLVFCGYLIGRGRLHPVWALISAVAGSWSGISVSFLLGRFFGLGVVHRYGRYIHLDDRRLAKVNFWFHRTGHWALFFGYYIAGVRHLTAIVAGTSHLDLRTFMAYAWTGGAVWVGSFLTLGYYLGENWRTVAGLVHRYLAYISILLVAGALLFLLVRLWVRRRQPDTRG